MKWSDLVWQKHPFSSVLHARLSFGDEYELSVVQEINEKGLYEVAIFLDGNFVQLPGIHPESDDDLLDSVLRFQTREEVVGIVRKLESITGESPLNVYE